MYRPESGDSLEEVARKLSVSAELLLKLNGLESARAFSSKQEVVVPQTANLRASGIRELSPDDLHKNDFDRISERLNEPVFLVEYYTVKGVTLGKLVVRETELVFEPLSKSFTGLLNQQSTLKSRQLFYQQATATLRQLRRPAARDRRDPDVGPRPGLPRARHELSHPPRAFPLWLLVL